MTYGQQKAPTDSKSLSVPRVFIPRTVWDKLMAYVIACPDEISGLGYVSSLPEGDIHVDSIFILPQVVSGGDVEVDAEGLAQRLDYMVRNDIDPNLVRFQWHSHVNMDAYFSLTDTNNIERWGGDWLVSLVANKFGEYDCRLDTFPGSRRTATALPRLRTATSIKPLVYHNIPDDIQKEVGRDIAAMVRRRTSLRKRPGKTLPAASGEATGVIQELEPMRYNGTAVELLPTEEKVSQ